jgi:hypothetical protein
MQPRSVSTALLDVLLVMKMANAKFAQLDIGLKVKLAQAAGRGVSTVILLIRSALFAMTFTTWMAIINVQSAQKIASNATKLENVPNVLTTIIGRTRPKHVRKQIQNFVQSMMKLQESASTVLETPIS